MFETSPSGHIDPRRLIRAQLAVIERRGGIVIRDCVTELRDGPGAITIVTAGGTRLQARQVLVAAGAFTNLTRLVSRPPALILKSETVILARVSAAEAARLRALPSLLYEIDTPEVEGIYATPPLRYPDGRHYLKMGCNLPADLYFGRIWKLYGSGSALVTARRTSAPCWRRCGRSCRASRWRTATRSGAS